MFAVIVGTLLAGAVVGTILLLRRPGPPEEPMLPEPHTDWTD